MKIVLELQEESANVRRITVRHDIVIGRSSECNLRLSSPQVSRRHCFLRVGRDSSSVTDLDSSNGTFLDGRRIASGRREDLREGVCLALGPVRFVVHIHSEVVEEKHQAVRELDQSVQSAQEGFRTGLTAVRSAESLVAESLVNEGPPVKYGETCSPMKYSLESADASAEPDEPTVGPGSPKGETPCLGNSECHQLQEPVRDMQNLAAGAADSMDDESAIADVEIIQVENSGDEVIDAVVIDDDQTVIEKLDMLTNEQSDWFNDSDDQTDPSKDDFRSR